ncbi:DUF4333 domain-containing protein [Prauserella sp. ASG 168]|uniref:DUF4333 domain-containing protein n=2 Tax=Prauserella cavernicola TaxID=2800127 RepID=A0A934QXU6_9PSEU|nr:DUF4333 domain-containing protein [Prauserella cavernicola]
MAVAALALSGGCSVTVTPTGDSDSSSSPASTAGSASSSAPSGPSLSAAELEQRSTEALTQTAGQRPAKVECPGPLAAQIGQSIRCVLTADDGSEIGFTITVESSEPGSDQAKLDIQVDDEVLRGPTGQNSGLSG